MFKVTLGTDPQTFRPSEYFMPTNMQTADAMHRIQQVARAECEFMSNGEPVIANSPITVLLDVAQAYLADLEMNHTYLDGSAAQRVKNTLAAIGITV